MTGANPYISIYINARVTQTPADITAEHNGQNHYFEIKYTKSEHKYFGAATLTEWEAALKYQDSYWFVVAQLTKDKWNFSEYHPQEFMKFSYIPPFKIFFNVPLQQSKPIQTMRPSKTVRLTSELVAEMVTIFRRFRGT